MSVQCANPDHDHTTTVDGNGMEVDNAPMSCGHCKQPAHYDYGVEDYGHDDREAADCFLMGTVGTPCVLATPVPAVDVKTLAKIAGGQPDEAMSRDDALAALRALAEAVGCTVKRGRIYIPGRSRYYAGTGSMATAEQVKSAWTEFAYGVAYFTDGLELLAALQAEADKARSNA